MAHSLADLSHYRLYYGFKSSKYSFQINTNKPIANVNGLIAGSNYYFAVVAVNSNGVESDFSNEFFTNVVEGTVQPALEILTSTNAITVPEGGTATFQVKLNTAPVKFDDDDRQPGQRARGSLRPDREFAGVQRHQLEHVSGSNAFGGGRRGPAQ